MQANKFALSWYCLLLAWCRGAMSIHEHLCVLMGTLKLSGAPMSTHGHLWALRRGVMNTHEHSRELMMPWNHTLESSWVLLSANKCHEWSWVLMTGHEVGRAAGPFDLLNFGHFDFLTFWPVDLLAFWMFRNYLCLIRACLQMFPIANKMRWVEVF